MVSLLRTSALGLTALIVAAGVSTTPVDSHAPDPRPDDRLAALAAHAARAAHAEADVIRERRGHDGTRIIEEEWHDPGLPPATGGADAPVSAAALDAVTAQAGADTFALHSRPGAPRTIYLDFDGGTLLSTNTWLLNGLATLLFPGWTIDGSAGFSTAELAIIDEVWARVAEDYAPFDVDVTTQEPPLGALYRSGTNDTTYGTRVAFTSGTAVQSGVCSGPCGGIAWVGVFDRIAATESSGPAWVFPSSLGNRAKTMAEAAAHEAGHTLGLNHDGTASSGYYSGSALWGPIMGSPYNSAISQWSKGDYPGANNTEDDVAEIVAGGAPLRPDEAGATPATAWPITSLPGQQGVISTRNDVDWISVSECSGIVTARVDTASVGPNLDVRLEVHGADGGLIAAAAPATVKTTSGVSGMGASVDVPLTGGPYYLAVSADGSGSSWAAGGYDSYGSLGNYRVYAAGCAGAPPPPISIDGGSGGGLGTVTPPGRPATPRVGGVRSRKVVVKWSAPANTGGGSITGYLVVAHKLNARGKVVAKKTSAVQPASSRRATIKLRSGRWSIVVRAANQAGWSTPSKGSVVRSR